VSEIFSVEIDDDGFVRLAVRIYGPTGKSVRLTALVDTGSSYVIIPVVACQLAELSPFDPKLPEVSIVTGCGIVKAPLMKVNRIEILGSSISEENVATVCHDEPGLYACNMTKPLRETE